MLIERWAESPPKLHQLTVPALILAVIAPAPAIVLAHVALYETERSTLLRGRWLAVTAAALSYASAGIIAFTLSRVVSTTAFIAMLIPG